MEIKGLHIQNKAVLAPMAGFCDIVMRKACDYFDAGFTVSEMVSARALYYGDKKSHQLMETFSHKHPFGVQLFGFDPNDFVHATKHVLGHNPDFIDINMGCPAPKIVNNGSGSALMKNPKLAVEIAKATVENAGGKPVSVKIRKGWDENCLTAVEMAQRCEAAGVSFITVHARTKAEMYQPGIDLDIIRAVKQAVNIPVIGNGDITCPEDAIKMMDYTGCDYVMVGREALRWHIEKLCEVNGETAGMKKARGQAALYMKGLRGAAHLRYLTNSLTVFSDAENLVKEVLKENV